MTPIEFVSAVKEVVETGAIRSIVSALNSAPNQKQAEEISKICKWLDSRPIEDRCILESLIVLTAKQTLYNFLLVLDGDLAIERQANKGQLKLLYEVNSHIDVLSEGESEDLSYIYKYIQN